MNEIAVDLPRDTGGGCLGHHHPRRRPAPPGAHARRPLLPWHCCRKHVCFRRSQPSNWACAEARAAAAAANGGGGWRRLTWFGDYALMGAEGWIWHNKHGFFYVSTSSTPGDVWLYANDMGWLYTGNTLYPYLYRSSPAAWLWYNGSTSPRWFRNMNTGRWESRW